MTQPLKGAPAASAPSLPPAWTQAMETVWRTAFGDPDLGPVDFARLRRPHRRNDALACPKTFCPLATPQFEPPVFPVSAQRLRALVAEMVLGEPDVTLVEQGAVQDRYVVRTRLLRAPDTVVVQAIPLSDTSATLALYSRSQAGLSDFGVNRRRLKRWVSRIGTLAAPLPERNRA